MQNIKFWQIMLFYAVLSCLVAPMFAHFFMPTKRGLELGYLAGTALSLALWFTVGKYKV
jgi:hypothetical protein